MPPQVIMLRTSERTTFKRCRQAWWWAYIDHLKPREERPALRFGTLVHKALEARYPKGKKRGPHPTKVFKRLYDADLDEQVGMGFRDSDGVWQDARDLGIDMLDRFVEHYGEDEEWEVLASELPFQVEIHRTPKFVVVYTGIIDGVWRNRIDKTIWINDWKTAKSIDVKRLPFNEQATSYWGFAPVYLRANKIIKPTDELRGITFTYLRKAMSDDRPTNAQGLYLNQPTKKDLLAFYERTGRELPGPTPAKTKLEEMIEDLGEEVALPLGQVSKSQPAPYFVREPTRRTEYQSQLLRYRALEEAKDMMRVRQGKLHVGKTFADHCGWCHYTDMCELHEIGQDWEAFRDGTMVKWEPYAEHEIQRAELT